MTSLLRKIQDKVHGKHYIEDQARSVFYNKKSKGEMPKCKTCERFSGFYIVENKICYHNPFGATMKPCCELYKRRKKTWHYGE